MANNKLNIQGANLEDLQETADRYSEPEDLAASQPESPAEAADQYAELENPESGGQQETADQHSRPEAPAASDQPEDSLAALRRALKTREDAKLEAPISSLETQAAKTRLALGIGRTAFRAVDMLENPTGKPPADSLGDPESNSERSDSSELADESVERADGDSDEAKELDEQNKQNGSPDKNKDEERSDKESSEALKSLADSMNHRLQAMADTVENAINTIRARSRDYVSLSSGDMQWLVSNVPDMLNGFVGAVEGAIDGLPLVEASRLNDAVDEIRHRLTALNNVIAEQRWNDVSNDDSNDDYLRHTIALKDSVAELQNFMNAAVSRQNQAETDDAYSRGKRAGRYIAGD
jgi:hypothetical protein